jgi:ABC-type phosphate/phosphonate transport system substrate-binding protein
MTTRLLTFLAAGWLLLAGAAAAEESPAGPGRESLRVGISGLAFAHLKRNDAEAAFKVFAGMAGRRRGLVLDVTVRTFDDPVAFATAVRAGELHLVMPDAWSFLEADFGAGVAPAFVSAGQDGPLRRYVLALRRDRRPADLTGLAGRSLLIYDSPNAGIGAHWLEVVLRERGHGGTQGLFRDVQRYAKPAAVVLPVFFGRADVCLVDAASLALMAELNPQVGRELVVVLESEPLLNSLIALSVGGWRTPAFREAVEQALAELHEDPAGRQILTLFQNERLQPYEPGQFESVRQLRARARAAGLPVVGAVDPAATPANPAPTAASSSP